MKAREVGQGKTVEDEEFAAALQRPFKEIQSVNDIVAPEEDEDAEGWAKIMSLKERRENVEVHVKEAVKAGVTTTLEGIRAFIPASGLSLSYVEEDDLKNYVGRTLTVRVITADKALNKLVLSARDVLKEKAAAEKAEKIKSVEAGQVLFGKVSSIKDYGAFIDLPDGLSGLLHISEVSEKRINRLDKVLSVGQEVRVKVKGIKDGKISLSMKDFEEEDREEAREELSHYDGGGELTTSFGDLLKNVKI
ncbi:MAG: S1 RNA-binding domain-containing protein [Lachnospiraceae bacterium]|nr:S1 RNA-binding domain-containing protein [Lachnospiraceae bacterium]